MSIFRNELESLLNEHSREHVSDTPDFILAVFLTECLAAWDKATVERDRWHGFRDGEPWKGGPLKKWEEEIHGQAQLADNEDPAVPRDGPGPVA